MSSSQDDCVQVLHFGWFCAVLYSFLWMVIVNKDGMRSKFYLIA